MTHAHEAVKTRHKETSLVFPLLALAVLFFFGSSQSLPVVIAINILALVGILSSAFSVVRHADVLAHRLGEPYGSLILSLSVVILEVSLISALMATGDAAPTLMRDTLYSIIMIVTGGLVGFSLLLGGRKFATQYMNLFGIKQYLIALLPVGDYRAGVSHGPAWRQFLHRSGAAGGAYFGGHVRRFPVDSDQNAPEPVYL
ncbi:Calcium/proton antiporter [Raoultella terrigena]|uniref:Calcium/proton antiporter n=1 Tax=Raoultella terrigena TaxID=577 RepID=A0A485C3Z9_RAOTE|nr:Calcium/proton antiporter [Raoultella terrigena]